MAAKKKSKKATKKAETKKATTKMDVTFTDEIPPVTRESNGTRSSKYDPLIEACRERPGKAARMAFDTQGKATSRYQSIKTLVDRQDDADHFTLTTRSDSEKSEFVVFLLWNEEAQEDES